VAAVMNFTEGILRRYVSPDVALPSKV